MKYIFGFTLAAFMLTGCVEDRLYRHDDHSQVKKDSEHHERDRSENRDRREYDEHRD